MSETCYSVPPDRDVIVLDQDDPAWTAATLIEAAVAAGYPIRSVRYQAETGGFLVPAAIANIEAPPAAPIQARETHWVDPDDPMTWHFDASASDGGVPPLTYAWNLGEADAYPTGITVQHTYATPGTKTCLLTVNDSVQSTRSMIEFTVTVA